MAGSTRKQGGNAKLIALFLVGAGLLFLGVAAFFVMPRPDAAASDQRSALPTSVEYPAPQLDLTDLQGNAVSLEDYHGQVVLVNNWATWCPPCKAEMPTLQAYYDDYSGEGFTIIAIDAGDPLSDVAEFVKEYGLTFPVWPDLAQKATVAFRNPGLPSSYVIDRQGVVRLAWTGAISRGMLDKFVTPLLEE
jgi:cytochrome c biogenesis protein CcmG, thiol:disulfide interchange protein DsbE